MHSLNGRKCVLPAQYSRYIQLKALRWVEKSHSVLQATAMLNGPRVPMSTWSTVIWLAGHPLPQGLFRPSEWSLPQIQHGLSLRSGLVGQNSLYWTLCIWKECGLGNMCLIEPF